MILSFDYDDVLAEFQRGWVEFNNKYYGTKLHYNDFYDFNYSVVMGIPYEEIFKRLFEYYDTEEFMDIKPVDGAIDAVSKLAENNTLYVLTSRASEIREKSETWLNKYFPNMFREVLFTNQISRDGFTQKVTKVDLCQKYKIEFHVDDAPVHVVPIAEKGIKVAVPETPWNKATIFESPLVTRMKTMRELLYIV